MRKIFFKKYITNIDTHTYINIHSLKTSHASSLCSSKGSDQVVMLQATQSKLKMRQEDATKSWASAPSSL
jgi:hypothetical protein